MGCERHGNSDAETLLETAMELWPTPCWPLRLEPSRNHREGPMPNGTGPSCFYRAITTYRPVNSSPSAVQKCDHLAHFVIRWIRSRRDMLPHRQEINEYSRSLRAPSFLPACRRERIWPWRNSVDRILTQRNWPERVKSTLAAYASRPTTWHTQDIHN